MTIVDLTHRIADGMPVYPGTPEVAINQQAHLQEDAYAEKLLHMSTHTGTHMDAPAHMIRGGKTLDNFSLSKFTGRACLIPFTHDDVNEQSIRAYLSRFERDIRESDFVILCSKWSEKWGTQEYFQHFPALDEESAEFLAGFHLKAIGIDTISIDVAESVTYEAHHILLSEEILIVENLCHLDRIRSSKFLFSAFPLFIAESDGSPVRAMAQYE